MLDLKEAAAAVVTAAVSRREYLTG